MARYMDPAQTPNVWKTDMDGRAPQPAKYSRPRYGDGSGQGNADARHPGSPETEFKTTSNLANQVASTVGNILLYRTLFNNKNDKGGKDKPSLFDQDAPSAPGLGNPPAPAGPRGELNAGARPMHPNARGPMKELGPAPTPIAVGPVPQRTNRSSDTFDPRSPGMNPSARRELPGEPAGYGRSGFQPDLTADTRPGRRAPAGADPRRLRNLNLPKI